MSTGKVSNGRPAREAATRKRWLPTERVFGRVGVLDCELEEVAGVVRRGVDERVEELRCGEFVALRSARLPLRRDQNPATRRPSASSRWP
jgi:hypothetical protein